MSFADTLVHVIDDDDAARDSLSFLLSLKGFKVADYASAEAFLNARPALHHALIITDVRMPGMSGIELVAALKAGGVSAPVVIITGHGDIPLAVQAMKVGAIDFIEKPFSEETILRVLKTAVSQLQGTQEKDEAALAVQDRLTSLSQREAQVLEKLVEGKPNKIIAKELGISPRTVEIYRANVMTKMQATSLSELVRLSLQAKPS